MPATDADDADTPVPDLESGRVRAPVASIATRTPEVMEASSESAQVDMGSSQTGLTDMVPPLVKAVGANDEEPLPTEVGRFRILGLIARGGMGIVLRAVDPLLGRELALKVMRPGRADAEQQRRFIAEAQISGRLQHPGIVPLHEMARDAQGRPFFVMKLIEGRTLAELLAARSAPDQDLPRFLHIFEQVCQTLAYAHSKGLLHRDLKPHNIMVGEFGEVQVMDWGLAKSLRQGDKETRRQGDKSDEAASSLDDSSPSPNHQTRDGTVIGTLSYMSPEQARGEVQRLAAQSDVFGLGAILCEILTGLPPFHGQTWIMLLPEVQQGNLDVAWKRLATCNAEEELKHLARACLAPRPENRPADASAVAERITAHLNGVQERLRQAELARAQAQAKAVQQRRAFRLQMALALAVLLLLAVGVGGGVWLWHAGVERRQATDSMVRQALADARVLKVQGQHAGVLAALRQTDSLMEEADAELVRAVKQLRDEAEQAVKDQVMLAALEQAQLSKSALRGESFNASAALDVYPAAFVAYGLPVETSPVEEMIDQVRRSALREQLCTALDDWAFLKKQKRLPRAEWERLWQIAAGADPDPWRNQLRQTLQQPKLDAQALRNLTDQMDASQPLASLQLVVLALSEAGELARQVELWRKAYARQPHDFWVNQYLGISLRELGPAHYAEALRHLTVAAALRPDSPGAQLNMGHILDRLERNAEAEAAFRRAAELAPNYAMAQYNLGLMRVRQNDPEGAARYFKKAVDLKPDMLAAHSMLGKILARLGRKAEGVAAARRAVELAPNEARPLIDLGFVHEINGQRLEALAVFQQALAKDEQSAEVHLQVGRTYLLLHQPAKGLPHLVAAERKMPNDQYVLINLGQAFEMLERFDEALPPYAKAAELYPHMPLAHFKRGVVLMKLGRLAEAIAALDLSHQLRQKQPGFVMPAAEMAALCRKLLELEKRLPAVAQGQERPRSADECLDFAQLCWDCRREYAAGVLFYDAGLHWKPAGDLRRAVRFRRAAAGAAVRAACGLGVDSQRVPEADRPRWRRRGLRLLEADLKDWTVHLYGPDLALRQQHRAELEYWLIAPDLACVRDPELLPKLPVEEQQEWRAFWEKVADVLRNAPADESPGGTPSRA